MSLIDIDIQTAIKLRAVAELPPKIRLPMVT